MVKKYHLIALFLLFSAGIQRASANDIDTVWMRYTQNITKVQFSNDDSKILTVGDGGIMIFDTQTGTQLKQLPGYLDAEYSSDGYLIIAVREKADSINHIFPYIDVINTLDFVIMKTIKLPKLLGMEGYSKISVSRDMQKIAVTSKSAPSLYLVDYLTDSIKKIDTFGIKTGNVMIGDFVFTKNGNDLIISISIDIGHGNYIGELIYINTQTYQMDYNNNKVGGQISISEDGTMLALGTSEPGKAVTIMNTQTHEIINSVPGIASSIKSIAFSPDGQYLVVSSVDDFKIIIYQISDLSIKKSIYLKGASFGLDITKNNEYLAAAGSVILFRFLATSVPDEQENTDVLYPNLTDNAVILKFELNIPTQLTFNLYDMTGKQVANLKNDFYNSGLITENLLLGNLANGSYYLKIESLKFNKTFKVIINK